VGPAASVPVAIDDLLDRRLARLGDAARQVLQAATIVATDVDFALLRHIVQLTEREILDGLDECLAASVLEETPLGYRYRHGLIREAAHARLSRARRQQLHRAIAHALVETGGGDPALVGGHFALCDEPWRAVAYLAKAANAAAGVFDNPHACALFEQAI